MNRHKPVCRLFRHAVMRQGDEKTQALFRKLAFFGAADRTRTGTVSLPRDFKSLVSTNSTTAAMHLLYYRIPLLSTVFALSEMMLWISHKKTSAAYDATADVFLYPRSLIKSFISYKPAFLPCKNTAALMDPTANTPLDAAEWEIVMVSSCPANSTSCSPTMVPPRMA